MMDIATIQNTLDLLALLMMIGAVVLICLCINAVYEYIRWLRRRK